MSFEVNYWLTRAGKEGEKITSVCFNGLPNYDDGIQSIRYICPIDDRITDKEVDFYLAFVEKILSGGRDWTCEKQNSKKGLHSVEFLLDTYKNWNKYNILVYLSAFRLLDESAEIVKELYKSHKNKFDTQFVDFQKIHKEVSDGKIILAKNGLHTLCCHGLMYYYPYGGTCKPDMFSPIKYETFNERLKKIDSPSVHKYFRP